MFSAARRALQDAVSRRVCPAAVIEVGTTERPLWSEAFGRLSYDENAPPTRDDTIFDLASLTKVLATTPLVIQAVEQGVLALDDTVASHIAEWSGADRATVTVRDLLAHCSGLPAHRPYFENLAGQVAFTRAICAEPLESPPRTQAVYSDLGFMLLGFMLGGAPELPRRLTTLLSQMNIVDPLQFDPPSQWHRRIAPTAFDPWRNRMLLGDVDDGNAAALGGCAGHAGLFGTAAAVGSYSRHILQVLDGRTGAVAEPTVREFLTPDSRVPGSSRALGWDTMRPTSSCGTRMSPTAFGHTGFTGTSLWIDPEARVYVVMLTNRVHPDRSDRGIQDLRRNVHDAVMDEWRRAVN